MRENDLRVIKTKRNLRQSLLVLLQEKPLESISVQELCGKAQCSRNTFYIHYSGKDALYEEIVDGCISSIEQGAHSVVDQVRPLSDELIDQYTNNVMDGVLRNMDELRIIVNGSCHGMFEKRLTEVLFASYIESGRQMAGSCPNSAEWMLACRYMASGFVGFILFWLNSPEISVNRARQVLRELIESPLHTAMNYLSGN